MFNLIDKAGNDINAEDIIKYENLGAKEVAYFLCGEKMLYRYDEQGMFLHDSLRNIKLDKSVTMVNDEVQIWTRMGIEAEVFDEIFG
jgi:ribosomal protein L35AE/L33A